MHAASHCLSSQRLSIPDPVGPYTLDRGLPAHCCAGAQGGAGRLDNNQLKKRELRWNFIGGAGGAGAQWGAVGTPLGSGGISGVDEGARLGADTHVYRGRQAQDSRSKCTDHRETAPPLALGRPG